MKKTTKQLLKLYALNFINMALYYLINYTTFQLTNDLFVAFVIPTIITSITGYIITTHILEEKI